MGWFKDHCGKRMSGKKEAPASQEALKESKAAPAAEPVKKEVNNG